MNKQFDLHNMQMLILKKLLFLPFARFRDLKIEGLTTDHLSYHINTLVKKGFLEKNKDKRYTLTDMGKEFSNRMDEKKASIENQGKRVVAIRVTRMNKNRQEFLFMKRLKQPFYGCVGFHTGKVREKETIFDSANRELKEETNLQAKIYFVGIFHYIDYKSDGTFLRDIYFYTFNGYNPSGKLIELNKEEGVENFWATKNRIKKEKVFPGFRDESGGLGWVCIPLKPQRTKKYLFHEKVRIIKDY